MKRLFFLVALLCLIPSIAQAAFPTGWYKQILVIDHTKVAEDKTNFPLLLTAASLPTDMLDKDGAHPAVDGGNSVRFYAYLNGVETRLSCEIVSLVTNNTPASATAEIYVLIPQITTYADKKIVVWWNPDGADAQPAANAAYGSQSVWTDYVLVSHNGGATDSTSNANNGTATGGVTTGGATGKIGVATDFDGTDDYFNVADSDTLSIGNGSTDGPVSFMAWASPDDMTKFTIMHKGTPSATDTTGKFEYQMYGDASDKLTLIFADNSITGYTYIGETYNTAITGNQGVWHHYAGTYSGGASKSAGISLYIDGSLKTTKAAESNAANYIAVENTDQTLRIGGSQYAGYFANGKIDEVRIAKAEFSANRMTTIYNNQNAPDTFTTVDSNTSTSADTWYVRPEGTTYGNADGTSFADAFSGFAALETAGVLNDFDTVYVCGTVAPTLTLQDLNYVTVRGDYAGYPGIIDGRVTVDNDDWVNVSGSLYRMALPATDLDYNQASAPASPTAGQKWFVQAYTASSGQARGRGLQYNNSKWEGCKYFRQPNMVWVDGVRKDPARTDGGTTAGDGSVVSVTNTAFAGHGDDYWNGAQLTIQTADWQYETRTILDSTDAGALTYATLVYNPKISTKTYIEGCYSEIDSNFEWAVSGGYLYIQLDSPTTHAIQYSGGGCGILMRGGYGNQIKNIQFNNLNDCGIISSRENNVTISGCIFDMIYPDSWDYSYGAIALIGIYESDWLDTTAAPLAENFKIDSCSVSNVIGGANGVYVLNYKYGDINSCSVSDIGEQTWIKGQGNGIHGLMVRNINITDNSVSHAKYSGILNTRIWDSLIDGNTIRYGMEGFSDGGVLYIGVAGTYNTISDNRIEFIENNSMTRGIYLDVTGLQQWEGIKYTSVTGNLFYKAYPAIANGGSCLWQNASMTTANYNSATNNTVYSSAATVINDGAESGNPSWWSQWYVNTGNTLVADETQYPYALGKPSAAAVLLMQ